MSTPVVLVGEAVAGESVKVRKQLEGLIKSLNKSTFDVGELLYKVKSNNFHTQWGFNTFPEYVKTLDIKPRKAQYLFRIAEVMTKVGITRDKYEALGIAKLRVITRLDPDGTYLNLETKEPEPMKDYIIGLIDKGESLDIDEIRTHVATLKGLVGENSLVWLNLCLKKSALEEIVRPALELAKNHIGSVGKDDEGMSKDAGDGAALEVIAVEYLNDPANNVLAS